MSPGPWAMSVMMQKLHPSSSSGVNSVMSPAGVMRAILAGASVNSVPSVNQMLPSGPLVIARGWLSAVGTLNCFSPPTGAASATLPSDNNRPAASDAATARPAFRDIGTNLQTRNLLLVHTSTALIGFAGHSPSDRNHAYG